MDKFPTIPIAAVYTQVDSKPVAPPPSPDLGQTVLAAGLGFAALGAVVVKLIEKFGSNEIETRQAKIKQELDQERSMSEFYIKQANRDAETISKALDLFITKHLDTNKQMLDLYYDLSEKYEKLAEQVEIKNHSLNAIEISLKNVFAVLSIKERNKS